MIIQSNEVDGGSDIAVNDRGSFRNVEREEHFVHVVQP